MKIFHEENGKEVVYVQMEDIMRLNHTDLSIPASIFVKVFGDGIVIVDNSNRFEFVKFEEEYEVTFFKELEFIIDYDKYKDYTNEQLEKEGQKLAIRANEIIEKWNSMTIEEREKNINLHQEIENIDYMLKFLSEIYAVKNGKRIMPFPEFVQLPKKEKKKLFSFLKKKK